MASYTAAETHSTSTDTYHMGLKQPCMIRSLDGLPGRALCGAACSHSAYPRRCAHYELMHVTCRVIVNAAPPPLCLVAVSAQCARCTPPVVSLHLLFLSHGWLGCSCSPHNANIRYGTSRNGERGERGILKLHRRTKLFENEIRAPCLDTLKPRFFLQFVPYDISLVWWRTAPVLLKSSLWPSILQISLLSSLHHRRPEKTKGPRCHVNV